MKPSSLPNHTIRSLDTRKDLMQAADLIEVSFGHHLDPDGHTYLQQIRNAAREQHLVKWSYAAGELVSYPLNGYVCEADGRIVGNLSLIPFYWQQKWRYLIANVAVDPAYRRQGIARELTIKALEHVSRRPIDSVWLHVRADNKPAIQLYEQLDFTPRAWRDTWVSHELIAGAVPLPAGARLGDVQAQDWRMEAEWMQALYPPEVAWHQSLDLSRYKPGFWNWLRKLLELRKDQHWGLYLQGDLLGAAILETGFSYADQVFLAPRPGEETRAIPALLAYIQHNHASGRTLMVNFPAGFARPVFERAGFELQTTLIWMEIRIN